VAPPGEKDTHVREKKSGRIFRNVGTLKKKREEGIRLQSKEGKGKGGFVQFHFHSGKNGGVSKREIVPEQFF